MMESLRKEITDLNRDFGELSGLFRAHIKETDRERTAHALQATDDRAERKVISDKLDRVLVAAEKIGPMEKRLAAAEKTIDGHSWIIAKITIAASIIAGGFTLAAHALIAAWPFLRDHIGKFLK